MLVRIAPRGKLYSKQTALSTWMIAACEESERCHSLTSGARAFRSDVHAPNAA